MHILTSVFLTVHLSLLLYFISQNVLFCADEVICVSPLGGSLSCREDVLSEQAFQSH